jgi:uncharacterized protein YlxW (UPF0749 family)
LSLNKQALSKQILIVQEKLDNPEQLWDALSPFQKGLYKGDAPSWWKRTEVALQQEKADLQKEKTALQQKEADLQKEKTALQQKEADLQRKEVLLLEIQSKEKPPCKK